MDQIKALEHRLWQAERAAYDWPSTRNQDRVCYLRRDLRRLTSPAPVTPAHNTAPAKWPPVAAK